MPRPPRPTLFPYTTLFRSMSVHRLDAPAVTISVTALECVSAPLVRVVAHTSELQSAVQLGCRLILEKKKLSELGLKLAVAPVGNPLTLRVTGPVKLPSAST